MVMASVVDTVWLFRCFYISDGRVQQSEPADPHFQQNGVMRLYRLDLYGRIPLPLSSGGSDAAMRHHITLPALPYLSGQGGHRLGLLHLPLCGIWKSGRDTAILLRSALLVYHGMVHLFPLLAHILSITPRTGNALLALHALVPVLR